MTSEATTTLRWLADQHLGSKERGMLRGCLQSAAASFEADEMPIVLTDAQSGGDFGLLLLTTDRLLFVDWQTQQIAFQCSPDDITRAIPVSGRTGLNLLDDESNHVDVSLGDETVRFASVGQYFWAKELAGMILGEEPLLSEPVQLEHEAYDGGEDGLTSEDLSAVGVVIGPDHAPLLPQGSHALRDEWEIAAPADDVGDQLLSRVATVGGVVTSRSTANISGYCNIDRQPNIFLTVVLVLLFCGLGLIYYFLARRQEQQAWSVRLTSTDLGCRVTLDGQPGSRAMLAIVLDDLSAEVSDSLPPTSIAVLWDRLADYEPEIARSEVELDELLSHAKLSSTDLSEEQVGRLAGTDWLVAAPSGTLEEATRALRNA